MFLLWLLFSACTHIHIYTFRDPHTSETNEDMHIVTPSNCTEAQRLHKSSVFLSEEFKSGWEITVFTGYFMGKVQNLFITNSCCQWESQSSRSRYTSRFQSIPLFYSFPFSCPLSCVVYSGEYSVPGSIFLPNARDARAMNNPNNWIKNCGGKNDDKISREFRA